jgi:hypothetical protein
VEDNARDEPSGKALEGAAFSIHQHFSCLGVKKATYLHRPLRSSMSPIQFGNCTASIVPLDLPSVRPDLIDLVVDGVHHRSKIGSEMPGLPPCNVRLDPPLRPISGGGVRFERGRVD